MDLLIPDDVAANCGGLRMSFRAPLGSLGGKRTNLAVFVGIKTRQTGQYGDINIVFGSHSVGLCKLKCWRDRGRVATHLNYGRT